MGNGMLRGERATYARNLNITVYSISAATEAIKCYCHNCEKSLDPLGPPA